jgi:hypothetical protein
VRTQHAAELLFGVYLAAALCHGEDLAPRAFVITPVHSNAIMLTCTPALPLDFQRHTTSGFDSTLTRHKIRAFVGYSRSGFCILPDNRR